MPFLEQLGSAKWTEIISEAVTDSFIVWVKMVSLSIRFQRINATRMNSLSYLPCFALLRMHLCRIRRQASQSALPPFLSLPLFSSVCTEPAQIQFYCIYLFIYSYLFSISEASYQRPPNLRSRVAGELPGLHLSPYERVCVCVFRDKIKIQMERKHWNHHFSYRQLRGLRLPLLTNSSRVMKQKALKCTHFMTHRISFK